MGKAEERSRVDRIVVCEERLIWFEGMPVVVGDESMAAGLFLIIVLRYMCMENFGTWDEKTQAMRTFRKLYVEGVLNKTKYFLPKMCFLC